MGFRVETLRLRTAGSQYNFWAVETKGEDELLGTWSHLAEAGILWACLAGAEAMEETQLLLQTLAKAEMGEREKDLVYSLLPSNSPMSLVG